MNLLAYVDLTTEIIQTVEIPESLRRQYLGGRGLNMWLLNSLLPCGVDPFSGENVLIIGAGLLSGFNGPSLSRLSISGKSPETGWLGDANIGGYFAARLRRAGFSHLVIRGQAKKPVLLVVQNGMVTISDARDLWGRDCTEMYQIFRDRYGPESATLTIGPAGEKLVRFACVRSDLKSAAGRTGMGALMGSKNLKGIVAVGKKELPVVYSEAYNEFARKLRAKIAATDVPGILAKHGTPYLYDLHYMVYKISRVHNGLRGRFPGGRNLLSQEFVNRYNRSARACFSCSIGCRHAYTLPTGHGEVKGEGPEYAVVGTFGGVCGISSPEVILQINEKLNRLGLDACTTGNLIAWAMELYEHQLITTKETDGLELIWGNTDVVLCLIDRIAMREGFGDLLARGAREAARMIGGEAEKYLVWCKNLPQSDPVDVRHLKGFALSMGVATRGADHLRGRPTLEILGLSGSELEEIYGEKVSPEPGSSEGKACMVVWSENLYAAADSLGICKFALQFNSPNLLNTVDLAGLVSHLTPFQNYEPSELMIAGERVLALERLFLAREGMTPGEDRLPERYYQPLEQSGGPLQGIDREEYAAMVREYYRRRHLDPLTGRPDPDYLKALGITIGCHWGEL